MTIDSENSGSAPTVATASPEPKHSAKSKMSDGKAAERRLGLWLVAPAAILMIAVTAYPVVYAVWLSFAALRPALPGSTKVRVVRQLRVGADRRLLVASVRGDDVDHGCLGRHRVRSRTEPSHW